MKSVMSGKSIKEIGTLFSAQTVAAGESATNTVAVPIGDSEGSFVIEATIAGDGTVKFEKLTSCAGTYFAEPVNCEDLATGLTKTSGDGSGHVMIPVPPGDDIAKYMKIKITETGSSATVTVTAAIWGR